MQFLPLTDNPAMAFRHLNARGDPRWVLVMRATYDIAADGTLAPASPPPPLNFREQSYGHILETPPRFESDLAPEKPKTDLIINGVAHAPGGLPTGAFEVGLSLWEPLAGQQRRQLFRSRLAVTGPREWRYRGSMLGWTLSDPIPITEVPLRYDFAYGGTARVDDPAAPHDPPLIMAHPENPVGRGFVPSSERLASDYNLRHSVARSLLADWMRRTERLAAPQIGLPDLPLRSIEQPYPLAGWGVIAKHWSSRYRHAGTFDDAWLDSRHPLLPLDFDPHYWNGAHPALQLGELPPRSVVELSNLVPTTRSRHQSLRIALPGNRVIAKVYDILKLKQLVELRPDTVIVDLIDDQLTLLYRANIEDRETLAYVDLEVVNA